MFTPEPDHDVTFDQSGNRGRTAGLDRLHSYARTLIEVVEQRHAPVERNGRTGHTEMAAPHATVLQKLWNHPFGDVDRHREADRLRAADDRGVDANHFTARVQQRSARVAWVQCGVGLNHIRDQASRAGTHAAAERADDPCRHRVFEAERIADRDCDLATTHIGRAAETRVRECTARARVDAQQREVAVRIVTDPFGVELASVTQRDQVVQWRAARVWRLAGPCDVRVGQQVAIGCEEKSRSPASRLFSFRATGHAHRRHAWRHAFDNARHSFRVRIQQKTVVAAHSSLPRRKHVGIELWICKRGVLPTPPGRGQRPI